MKILPLLLAMMALAASPSWAANDSREKQMLRRMQQQVQQLDQARAQSEQEKATALADKETAERELEKARSDEAARKRQLAGERAARSRIEAELKALQAESEALKARWPTASPCSGLPHRPWLRSNLQKSRPKANWQARRRTCRPARPTTAGSMPLAAR